MFSVQFHDSYGRTSLLACAVSRQSVDAVVRNHRGRERQPGRYIICEQVQSAGRTMYSAWIYD